MGIVALAVIQKSQIVIRRRKPRRGFENCLVFLDRSGNVALSLRCLCLGIKLSNFGANRGG